VVRIQSEIKRGILRSLWRASQAGQVGLHACLDGFQNASWSAIQSGQILISGSGGGYNSSLKIPGLSDQITQENFLALSEEYLNLYYSAIIYLLQEAYRTTPGLKSRRWFPAAPTIIPTRKSS